MRKSFNEGNSKFVYVNEKNGFVAYRAMLSNGTISEKVVDTTDNNKKVKLNNKKVKDFWKGEEMQARKQAKLDKHAAKQAEKENKDNNKGGKK